MITLSEIPFFSFVITALAYQAGLWMQKKLKHPACNPILIAVVIVIISLLLLRCPIEHYSAGWEPFAWLLTPATVCLAVPLYEQLRILKKNLPAIFIGVLSGTVVSMGSVWVLCKLFCLENVLLASLLPKSITTAIGTVLAEQMGGIAAITTVAIISSGILGACMGDLFCRIFHIQDPISKGVAIGTASHVIGTSKAYESSELVGAVGSLSLVIAGILTSAICAVL